MRYSLLSLSKNKVPREAKLRTIERWSLIGPNLMHEALLCANQRTRVLFPKWLIILNDI
jgi:hypothetical protein